jgi:hypothetical protein
VLPWWIRFSGLFPIRINSEILNLADSQYDSLGGEPAGRNVVTYRTTKTQGKKQKYMLRVDSNPVWL